MPVIQVKKVVAICFLEAAKLCLEHIASYRLELSQKGVPGQPDLPRFYGDTRRLRDYLQRCVSACPDLVELDLSPPDQALLVACCRRAVESIDARVGGDHIVPADEREWLLKKRQVIADWAVELAAKPLIELPVPRISTIQGEATRTLTTRLQNKVFGDVNLRAKILPPRSSVSSMTAGLPTMDDVTVDPPAEPPPPPPAAIAPIAEPAPAALPPPLFDENKVRDPRLRALAAVDLRTYQRALAAQDYRLSTIMLASLLEAALIDHCIPRRAELALPGTPDTWQPQELLARVMAENFQPKDNAQTYHLFASRNLLRPALQMVVPMVVTIASFERMRDFVLRALHAMGYASAAGPTPEDEPALWPASSQPTVLD
ncbi:MAG TPA: hypothetical protein VFZ65_01780 [Planctomycetota bacterium]|nr:hypothetical protein [Planctomycetota bacterium]